MNRPYEYTIKLIKSTILIRREATPNLFTITSYLLPREALNPNLFHERTSPSQSSNLLYISVKIAKK